jgi:phytoene dehydrogenase-like protein
MSKIAIIGAGMGGLVAGNLLARRGHKVTIFEAHNMPGGYTAGFRKKGFYFESGTLSFESSGMVFKAMKDIGVFDKVRFARQKTAFKSRDFEGVCETYDDLKKMIRAAYPQEKAALDRYFSEIDRMVNLMMAVMRPKTFIDYPLYPFRLLSFMSLYRKYDKMTIRDFTARFFPKDSKLYLFFNNIGYPDMSASIIPGAYLSFLGDYWAVTGGMQSWADALAVNFRDLDGELKLNSAVEKIRTQNGAAVGVTSQGKDHDADFVISACDYKKTFLKLLDDPSLLPASVREKIENAAVSEGVFTVYLGLKISNDQLRKYLKAPHCSFHDDQPEADIQNSRDEKYFEKTSIGLYSPSLHDPNLAPTGKSSLMIQVMTPYRWLNNWGGGDPAQYLTLKERIKKTLIAKAALVIPNLGKYIEFEDAATPLTYERYTGNTDGATSAWSWKPNKRFYKNIMSTKIDTPVRKLLIGSCWSGQIGGVPGAIGAAYACAKKIS